jgi:CubicO group peptidase (beta-lactamase class C family)
METGGHGLSATLRDLGRLGRFFLRGGYAGGRQMLPIDWTRAARVPSAASITFGKPYGRLIWVAGPDCCQARGIFGQMMHMDAARDLIIVQLSAWDVPSPDAELMEERRLFIEAVSRCVDEQTGGKGN